MNTVLVAYEDRYFEALDTVVRRVGREVAPTNAPREACSVEGVTNFPGFVQQSWPVYRDKGFPKAGKSRPNRLVCVADADKVVRQLQLAVSLPPADGTDAWVEGANQAFTAYLRGRTYRDPEAVHGVVLRWSLESLVIAAYDQPKAMEALAGFQGNHDADRMQAFLRRCGLYQAHELHFLDRYRDPQGCLVSLCAELGWPTLRKGDARRDEALKQMSGLALTTLIERAPDLVRIAALIREVAEG
jgi:hypothetical protein